MHIKYICTARWMCILMLVKQTASANTPPSARFAGKTRVFFCHHVAQLAKILIADYFWHWGGCDDWINGLFILSGLRSENYCRRAILRQFIMAAAKGQKSHDIGITVGCSQRESETFSRRKGKKRFLPIIDIYVLGAPYTFEPN
jgi:hypothetical protein